MSDKELETKEGRVDTDVVKENFASVEQPKRIRGQQSNKVIADEKAETDVRPFELDVTINTEEIKDLVAKRRQALLDLVEKEIDEQFEKQQSSDNKRDATRASKVARPKQDREGMSFGGPGLKRRVKQTRKVGSQVDKERDKRRGISRVYKDQPIRDVGEGTSATDIPKRRK